MSTAREQIDEHIRGLRGSGLTLTADDLEAAIAADRLEVAEKAYKAGVRNFGDFPTGTQMTEASGEIKREFEKYAESENLK